LMQIVPSSSLTIMQDWPTSIFPHGVMTSSS
jgi:hypothetical protein